MANPFRFRRDKQPEYTGSILAGNIEYHAPPAKTPWRIGRDGEIAAKHELERAGYRVTLTPFSWGPADLWAVKGADDVVGPTARLVQVKTRSVFEQSVLNEAVEKLLRRSVARGVTREAWLRILRRGTVVRVVISSDGYVEISGRVVYVSEVYGALQRAGYAA